MKIVPFSEARNNLKAVLDRVVEDADYTIITRRDTADAVVRAIDCPVQARKNLRTQFVG
jgi:antitoxin YefM